MGEFDHIAAVMQASPVSAELLEMAESGDFSRLERNAAKRQHFLPQFQLHGFARSDRGRQRMFQLDTTQRGAPRAVEVRTAASRHRLYAVETDDGPSNRLEGYLALVESHAAPALERMLADPRRLSAADRGTIAYLVALQTMRTPSAAAQVGRIANSALKTSAGEIFSDREATAAMYREHFDPAASDETIERFRRDVLRQVREGEIRLGGDNGAAFATAFQYAVANVPVVIACHWTLLRSSTGGFITSDRAYAIDDPAPPYPWAAQGLLSSERTEVTIPLSDCACLLVRPGYADARLDTREVSPEELERLNLRTYGWAGTDVFAKSQAILQDVRRAARRHPDRVRRPKPFCHVPLIELDPDDSSLADANRRRGWPAHLRNDAGERCDYLVIPDDAPHADLWQRADELAEQRARKRAGIGPDERIEGRLSNRFVHPLDLAS